MYIVYSYTSVCSMRVRKVCDLWFLLGGTLALMDVRRHQMGSFLCIAANNVPPAVSKRIMLNVNCKLTLQILET